MTQSAAAPHPAEFLQALDPRVKLFAIFAVSLLAILGDSFAWLCTLAAASLALVLLGDQTLDTALGHSGWTRYVELLIERIRSGRARDGILEIIEQLEPQLAFIAPRTEGDINELPDAPIR